MMTSLMKSRSLKFIEEPTRHSKEVPGKSTPELYSILPLFAEKTTKKKKIQNWSVTRINIDKMIYVI